ncbi:putative tellurium resistance membrane protein TerC [Thiogranum longum]|uniref:Putative tellurium resistance membrane protein TerC n=1 Tax=Thiogranum longum TaxID=1537524 RepID=A0A4R1HEV7_9GAMM|nr:tellurium resistance protein TerC [Thiogranum longum]TCK18730.1 putative tellurium resistance membrane protein TerC [Thiogranum longum]
MEGLFTFENLFTLGMLIMLQAVLGFDNLLYISLESKRVEPGRQSSLRRWGIGLAVALRLVLLLLLVKVLSLFQDTLFAINIEGLISGDFNLHGVVVFVGGIFILYAALKEISHMILLEAGEHVERKPSSYAYVLISVIIMNAVFSFDSMLSAMALTDNYIIMATAIVAGGILMILLADHVTEFLKKNRMYEVVGLFILFLVGVMLLSEGSHVSHLHLFGYEVTPMSKSTFYLVIFVMIAIDVVQSRYQKKLLAQAGRLGQTD